MKICRVGAESFHVDDGYTDMMKIIVAFRNFANVPKNSFPCPLRDDWKGQ